MTNPIPRPLNEKVANLYRCLQARYDIYEVLACKACPELRKRQHVVLGRGDPCATIHLIGEAPGADEDEQGLAFVGRAGRLLDTCIWKAAGPHPLSVGLPRVFIHNILKCRPPENRDPDIREVRSCSPWLLQTLHFFPPKVIVAMGRYSIGYFRGYAWPRIKSMSVTNEVKGKTFRWKTPDGPVVVPAFHPAYLLRNPDAVRGFVNRLRLAQRYAIALTKSR